MRGQMTLPAFRELPAETRLAQRARLVASLEKPRRRRPAMVLVVLLAALVATPALALRHELDFWSAEPAPERVLLQFENMRSIFPPAGGLQAREAREVTAITVDGERQSLWAAPKEGGGFCWQFDHVGSCDPSGLQFGMASRQSESAGIDWAAGIVHLDGTERVEVRYEDGTAATVPFVWVSPPIDAGFVLFDIPAENEREGHRPVAFVALDGDGNELARQPFRWGPSGP